MASVTLEDGVLTVNISDDEDIQTAVFTTRDQLKALHDNGHFDYKSHLTVRFVNPDEFIVDLVEASLASKFVGKVKYVET